MADKHLEVLPSWFILTWELGNGNPPMEGTSVGVAAFTHGGHNRAGRGGSSRIKRLVIFFKLCKSRLHHLLPRPHPACIQPLWSCFPSLQPNIHRPSQKINWWFARKRNFWLICFLPLLSYLTSTTSNFCVETLDIYMLFHFSVCSHASTLCV